MMDLHAAAKAFYNLTLADPEVIIRPPSAEKRDAIVQAGEQLRSALVAAPAAAAQPTDARWRKCEFCGCNTNAAVRACCDAGRQADRSAAAQGGQQPVAEVRLTLGMPIIEWVGRDYPVGTKLYTAPAPTAQGGQQPAGVTFPMPDKPGLTMACFDAQTVPVRTPLYTAPAAPAAPLTEEQIKKAVGASDEYWATSKLFIISIARAIEAAHGITLAGTAQKESADGR